MFTYLVIFIYFLINGTLAGILYPKDSETREVKSLDGLWNFKTGYNDDRPTIPMPVPASYNDVTVDKKIRDNVGFAVYDREFFVPKSWKDQRVWIRFGSVCYSAIVEINGRTVARHQIGHLPFEKEITGDVYFGKSNKVVVKVDNTLTKNTIPQGRIEQFKLENSTLRYQTYTFDFFNYAGIDRPVVLYTTPKTYIDDITILTDVSGNTGIIYYDVKYTTESFGFTCKVTMYDKEMNEVGKAIGCKGKISIQNAELWWPFLMNSNPGYMYELKVEILDVEDQSIDVYRQPVGIRKVQWNEEQVLINGKPIYIRGVGKHEDFFIKGKGLDLSVVVKDFELLKWMGINTFRTSHYPYAEEIMDMADSMGIMVIDECPSVDTDYYNPYLLQQHKNSLTELFQRDKNRPSVIMWSVANEPRTSSENATEYFGEIIKHMKSLDTTRPVTAVIATPCQRDTAAQFLDVIAFNRYNGWYSFGGQIEVIYPNVIAEAQEWRFKHRRPVILSEYGADTMAGMHFLPDAVWSEDYQTRLLSEHFKAFDKLRDEGFFIGEMVWNFADFQTSQKYTRTGGNKKGVFTREREPKAAAYILRKRNYELAHILEGAPLPNDLAPYTSSINETTFFGFD